MQVESFTFQVWKNIIWPSFYLKFRGLKNVWDSANLENIGNLAGVSCGVQHILFFFTHKNYYESIVEYIFILTMKDLIQMKIVFIHPKQMIQNVTMYMSSPYMHLSSEVLFSTFIKDFPRKAS